MQLVLCGNCAMVVSHLVLCPCYSYETEDCYPMIVSSCHSCRSVVSCLKLSYFVKLDMSAIFLMMHLPDIAGTFYDHSVSMQ